MHRTSSRPNRPARQFAHAVYGFLLAEPGHGWAEADSHVAIPTDERTLEQIRAHDLVPFARLSQQLAAVMPAHVIYPQVDSQRRFLPSLVAGHLAR